MTNDEKLKRRKKRQILKVFIIIFGLATLVLAICSLLYKISPIYAIITFFPITPQIHKDRSVNPQRSFFCHPKFVI